MGTLNDEEAANLAKEWSDGSSSYVDTFLPRFGQLYDAVANQVVSCIRNSDALKECKNLNVLDYGMGPGEPALTIRKTLSTSENSDIPSAQIYGVDFADGMVEQATRRFQTSGCQGYQLSTIKPSASSANIGPQLRALMNEADAAFHIIVSCLVTPYVRDLNELFNTFHRLLHKPGYLITTHWAHPSRVPTLRILKKSVSFAMSGVEATDDTLETTDSSFSLWRETETSQQHRNAGFEIISYNPVMVTMAFNCTDELLRFGAKAPWYRDPQIYDKARGKMRELVSRELGIKKESVDTDGFTLVNEAVLVVARRV
ncbi:S-adenosyl-L-methionine-dependent methyltransferase [Paraphysoderma sedebokerense]|nr:S-adenosyl-L-methionine-dependent methyltransferase [Paraphysoderma sedebokerense]KAI9141548.1 S-adenosyl-L-methionine-dependent methyltransferase [Paraphysoderma sedebokerense]